MATLATYRQSICRRSGARRSQAPRLDAHRNAAPASDRERRCLSVRQADRQHGSGESGRSGAARVARSRTMLTGFIAAMLVIAGLVPTAYNTTAGFTLQHLRQEQASLKQQQATLDLQEAELLSPAHLEQLAKTLRMVDPPPQAVQYLEGKAKNADARNVLPGVIEPASANSQVR